MNILVPDLGESVVEATILRWLKQPGERVAQDETIVELETDKVNVEVHAPGAGVLARIDHPEGADVKIGDVLGAIEPIGENASAPAPSAPEKKIDDRDEKNSARATPVAERMADEYGIDLNQVRASGSDDRITRQDIEKFLAQRNAPALTQAAQEKQSAPSGAEPAPARMPSQPSAQPEPRSVPEGARQNEREERVKMSRRRQTIARRLVEAQQTAAMLTTFNEMDMGAVMELRKEHNDAFKQRYSVKLGITSFFVKAAVGALKAFPMLNAEIQGDEIVLKHYYDIGVAVGAPEGLVVPVLRDADRMSFAEIENAINALAKKSEEGTLALDDLRGGTFTITNGGVFGSMLSTPILNPPQVGILGLHKIEERPIAHGGQVIVRPMMYVALSYDHRIVDGREAVQFLVRVKELIEAPTRMLLEI